MDPTKGFPDHDGILRVPDAGSASVHLHPPGVLRAAAQGARDSPSARIPAVLVAGLNREVASDLYVVKWLVAVVVI
jgi:hypothetical protein